jgi:formate transporter
MFEKASEKLHLNVECRNPNQTANFIIKELMVTKANSGFWKVVLLGILAGVYIGFGCEISTLAAHDGAAFSGFGPTRILAGGVFSLGLMLVVIAGGELFTSNTLIAGSVLDKKVSKIKMVKNWTLVYSANFVGSVLLAIIVFYTNLWQQNDLLLGVYALKIGVTKVNLTFTEAFTRGILCNWLVCLAIWMSAASRSVIGKIFSIFFPIMAFIALGYEHCVANMFYITKSIMLATRPELIVAANIDPEKLSHLNTLGFIKNLVPATLGNIVGGVIFLASFYWAAFVKAQDSKL